MNVPFSGSRTAGFRCERRAGLSLLLLLPLLLLSACRSRPEPSLIEYLPGAKDYAQVASIDTRAEIPQTEAGEAVTASMRDLGLLASGRYRVHLRGPDGGILKVHLMLFKDAEAAGRDYRERHHPQSMAATRPLAAVGDEAWIYPSAEAGEYLGLRLGRVRYEIEARGAASQLAPYARVAAAKAARLEQR